MINTIRVRNVQQALVEGCYQMKRKGVTRDSRNGRVLVMPGVTVTEYQRPTERVLLSAARDANPFFHLMEALWMISGRNDVAWPKQFNSKFDVYSDDGLTFNGAYGYRWREWFAGKDQLKAIIEALRKNPDCRRQVLAMWDGSKDLGSISKDIPCNLLATFQVGPDGELNMVVSNRSNDLIWGAYGANAVHFSMLLEYMAAHLRRAVGTYTQVSSNTHVYEPHWDLMHRIADLAAQPPEIATDAYSDGSVVAMNMVNVEPEIWDEDLALFLREKHRGTYRDPFFTDVAVPMFSAYVSFRDQNNPDRFKNAAVYADSIGATDWRLACIQWLHRREEAARAKVQS